MNQIIQCKYAVFLVHDQSKLKFMTVSILLQITFSILTCLNPKPMSIQDLNHISQGTSSIAAIHIYPGLKSMEPARLQYTKSDSLPAGQPQNQKKTKRNANRMALWGFIFSTLSILTIPFFALPGLYFSLFTIPGLYLSLRALKKEGQKMHTLSRLNRTLAEAGKTISVSVLVVLLCIILFVAFMYFLVFRR